MRVIACYGYGRGSERGRETGREREGGRAEERGREGEREGDDFQTNYRHSPIRLYLSKSIGQ